MPWGSHTVEVVVPVNDNDLKCGGCGGREYMIEDFRGDIRWLVELLGVVEFIVELIVEHTMDTRCRDFECLKGLVPGQIKVQKGGFGCEIVS